LFPHMTWTNSDENQFSYTVAPTQRPTCCGPFEMHLFRDGQEIAPGMPQANYGSALAFPVPADAGEYRLTYQAQTSPSSGGAGREVQAEWTFHSAPSTQP